MGVKIRWNWSGSGSRHTGNHGCWSWVASPAPFIAGCRVSVFWPAVTARTAVAIADGIDFRFPPPGE